MAATRFFDIPELVHHVATHLPNRSLAHLALVNSTLNEIAGAALYNSIFTQDIFVHPSNNLRGIARNAHHIRRIVMTWKFLRYYFASQRSILHENFDGSTTDPNTSSQQLILINNNTPTTTTTTTTIIIIIIITTTTAPILLPPPSEPDLVAFDTSLPPMTRLTHLTYTPWQEYEQYERDQSAHCVTGYRLSQLCYVVQSFSNLVYLELNGISVLDLQDPYLIAAAVSGLSLLKSLILGLDKCGSETTLDTTRRLVYLRCPKGVEEFAITGGSIYYRSDDSPSLPQVAIPVYLQPESWEQRLKPLRHLARWKVQGEFRDVELLCTMLRGCGELHRMEMPFIADLDNADPFIETVVQHRPKLRWISCQEDDNDPEGVLATRLLNRIAPNSIEDLFFRYLTPNDGGLAMRTALQRHSDTLTEIWLKNCGGVVSIIVQMIVSTCNALLELSVTCAYFDEEVDTVGLSLQDAVAQPWVCTKIWRLDLIVNIGAPKEMSRIMQESNFSEAQLERKEQLARFYQQIGALECLQVLCLEIPVRYSFRSEDDHLGDGFRRVSFPGWLSLGDPDGTGRVGYLSSFSRLTELRDLKGSVCAMAKETKETMGWREVEWFATNVPCLEVAEFFSLRDYVREPFAWLQQQRPNLNMRY